MNRQAEQAAAVILAAYQQAADEAAKAANARVVALITQALEAGPGPPSKRKHNRRRLDAIESAVRSQLGGGGFTGEHEMLTHILAICTAGNNDIGAMY